MRRFALMLCLAAAALVTGSFSAPTPAQAWDCLHRVPLDECYGYRPAPRGYYPYYNSGQWQKARYMRWKKRNNRYHYAYPQYNPAWGHPLDEPYPRYGRHGHW